MKNLILSVQHLLAMYAGAILVPIIVGTSLKFTPEQIAYLVTVDIFMCGVATFLQANKVTGTGLPIVLGCTFTAVAPMILIGQTKGIDVLYGSLFLSGILVIIIAPFWGKETVTIVPLSSKGNKNYLKLNESVLNLTATDLKKQIIDISSKVQALTQKYRDIDIKLSTEDKKLLSNLNQKANELYRVIGVYSKHKGKDTYVNISAITTISKRRISKINDSDPTGTIIISEDDMNEIEKQLKIKFFSNWIVILHLI